MELPLELLTFWCLCCLWHRNIPDFRWAISSALLTVGDWAEKTNNNTNYYYSNYNGENSVAAYTMYGLNFRDDTHDQCHISQFQGSRADSKVGLTWSSSDQVISPVTCMGDIWKQNWSMLAESPLP